MRRQEAHVYAIIAQDDLHHVRGTAMHTAAGPSCKRESTEGGVSQCLTELSSRHVALLRDGFDVEEVNLLPTHPVGDRLCYAHVSKKRHTERGSEDIQELGVWGVSLSSSGKNRFRVGAIHWCSCWCTP